MTRLTSVSAIVGAMLLSMATVSTTWGITYLPRGATADFDAGETNESIDGFVGAAGDGWSSAWLTKKDSAATFTTAVLGEQDSPLGIGTGNYLDYTITTSTTGKGASVGRNFGAGIDTTADYSINFLLRINELVAPFFDDFLTGGNANRYQVYSTGKTTLDVGSTPSSNWYLGAYGGDMTAGGASGNAGKWIFHDFVWDGSTTAETIRNSNIDVVQGTTYSFQIDVHPATYTWDATVSDGISSFTQEGMGWRNRTTSASQLLQFAGRGVAGATRDFSLDSITITQPGFDTVGGLNQVAARFNGGNSTTVVDAFTGMEGDGWNSAWTTTAKSAVITAAAVTSQDLGYNPIKPGSGAYLSATVGVDTGVTTEGQAGVGRDYGCMNVPGIDWTQEHTVKFTVRIDEDIDGGTSTFTSAQDRYQIVDDPSVRLSTSPANTWAIAAFGGADASITEGMVGEWVFGNGDGAGSIANYVDSDIALIAGGVYDFTVVVDPTSRTYDVSISDGTNSASFADLGWRTSATTVGAYVSFAAQGDTEDDLRAWSIDDLIISQGHVPGDANGDGRVDADDAKALARSWGMSGDATWTDGDFNGDLAVDAKDAAILAANWGYVAGAAAESSSATAVPEPGVAALLVTLLGGFVMGFGRRR